MAEDKEGTLLLVAPQHHIYTYNGKDFQPFTQPEGYKAPVVFQLYND
jgi:hypothetical protein